MKKKSTVFFAFTLLLICVLGLSACDSGHVFNGESAERKSLVEAIEKTEASKSIEIVQEINIYNLTRQKIKTTMTKTEGSTGTEAGLTVQKSQKFPGEDYYFGYEKTGTYYYAGAVCRIEKDDITDKHLGRYEDVLYEAESYWDIDIFGAAGKGKVTKKSLAGRAVEYTVSLSQKTVNEMLGSSESSSFFFETMEIVFVVSMAGYLKSYNYSLGLSSGSNIGTTNVEATVTVESSEIDFSIPDKVKYAIFDFLPEQGAYIDTADGVVKYHNLGIYRAVKYDLAYGKIIAARSKSVDIYDAGTMEKQHTLKYQENVECFDTDKGILAVGFGGAKRFSIYDLSDYSLKNTVETYVTVDELVMDGETIIYCDNVSHCRITFYNMVSGESIISPYGAYNALLEINRTDHRLYVCERGHTSCRFMYFDSQTGAKLYDSYDSPFNHWFNNGDIYFDGRFVHYFDRVFERFSGEEISANRMAKNYSGTADFAPQETKLSSIPIDIVSGIIDGSVGMAVHNNSTGDYIYKFPFHAKSVSYIGGSRYFIGGIGGQYISIVDLSGLAGNFEGDIYEVLPKKTVTVSEDGKVISLEQEQTYTLSACAGKYVYLLNQFSYQLEIYNAATLEPVKSIQLPSKPQCIDADGGWLAVGFGENKQFFLYQTLDWSFEIVQAQEKVYSILIYKENVIYASSVQGFNIYKYHIIGENHSQLPGLSLYSVSMDINRDAGILYLKNGSSPRKLVYYDLEAEAIICTLSDELPSGIERIFFDGINLHTNGWTFNGFDDPPRRPDNRTFDGLSGVKVSDSGASRIYKNISAYSNINTVYDDGKVSVFGADHSGRACTVFYGTVKDKVLYSVDAAVTRLVRCGDAYIILCDGSDKIYRVNV